MYPKKDLAVRHRPTTWEEIKGQSHVVNILRNQVLKKIGLSNAYLFYGPSGTGKTTIAKVFFKALNCKNISATGNACGECYNCTDDLDEVNAANNRGIDDMRQYGDNIRTPNMFSDGFRGLLLDECQCLTVSAWNVLLKNLENTPEHAIWLFATTEIETVPKTIQNRCQMYRIRDIAHAPIVERLQEIAQDEKIQISDTELLTIAKHCDNNLRQAIRLLEKFVSVGNFDWLSDEIENQQNEVKSKKNEKIILTGIQPQIVKALMALAPDVKNNKLKLPVITKELNMLDVQGKQIANELRAMGLDVPTDKKITGVSYVVWDSQKLTNLFKVYHTST